MPGWINEFLRSRWPKMLLWAAILVQAALVFVVAEPWVRGDTGQYLALAEALNGGRYGVVTAAGFQTDALRPPGYPLFLWLWLYKLGFGVPALVALQLGAYLAAIYVVQLFLERRGMTPLPFLLLAAAYPFAAMYVASVMTEGFALFGLTLVALLMVAPRQTFVRLAAIGLLSGLLALVRSDLILVPLVVAGYLVLRGLIARRPLGGLALQAAVPLLAGALVLAPYALWNGQNFGRTTPLPVAGAVGNSLYLTIWQGKLPPDELNRLYRGETSPAIRASGLEAEVRAINSRIGAPELNAPWNPATYPTTAQQIASTKVYREAALRRIGEEPGLYASRVLSNVWTLWNTSEYPDGLPAWVRTALTAWSGLVTILGLAGVAVALLRSRRDWPLPLGLTWILLYPLAVHLLLHTEARYTAPVRLLLLLHAAALLIWLVRLYARPPEREGSTAPAQSA